MERGRQEEGKTVGERRRVRSMGACYHDFMEDGSCAVVHLIKLINTADPIITEHQGTTGEEEEEEEEEEEGEKEEEVLVKGSMCAILSD